MSQQTVSLKFPAIAGTKYRALLTDAGFDFRSAPHADWQARGDAIITLYTSGKLVIQGQHVDAWVLAAEELGGSVKKWAGAPRETDATAPTDGGAAAPVSVPDGAGRFAAAIAKLPAPTPDAWIGIDEAGKGDYFGPLVTAAARVETSQLPLLAELGVGDSKALTDKRVLAIAAELRHVVPFEKVVLLPSKYNDLYARIGNLNKLLAWAHATAAEGLLEKGTTAELILSDQFAKRDLISSRLKERGKQLRFTQRTRAEEDPAVACASIFARSEFLHRMRSLSDEHGIELPKGAGPPVLAAGRRYVAERGFTHLGQIAKLHFKTTTQLG